MSGRSSAVRTRPASVAPVVAFFVGALALLGAPVGAHQFGALQLEIGAPAGDTLPVTLFLDPEHLPPGVVPEGTPAAERERAALEALVAGLELTSSGERLTLAGGGAMARTETPGGALDVARFRARLPADASSFRVAQRLEIGAFVVRAPAIEGAEAPLHWVMGGGEGVEIVLARPVAISSRLAVVRQYVGLGFAHIVPGGLDHVAFVLGLFLLSRRWKPLLLQVSAFTVAHTLTLAASVLGVVRLPAAFVEPAIALSIAWVAIENLVVRELKPWRTALVFGFGLLHGLGFAGVLAELGLPRARFLAALLSFNVGVELGQLAVLAAAFLAVGWARERVGYRRYVTVPGSLAIAAVGLFWFAQRTFFVG